MERYVGWAFKVRHQKVSVAFESTSNLRKFDFANTLVGNKMLHILYELRFSAGPPGELAGRGANLLWGPLDISIFKLVTRVSHPTRP